MPARRGAALLRYGGVGAVATLVHYAVLAAGVRWAGWPAWIASGVGAAVGAQVAYVGNRRHTFRHAGARRRSWPRFIATALAGGLLGMAIVAAGVHLGLHYLAAQAIATALAMLLTYAINRAWTFA